MTEIMGLYQITERREYILLWMMLEANEISGNMSNFSVEEFRHAEEAFDRYMISLKPTKT